MLNRNLFTINLSENREPHLVQTILVANTLRLFESFRESKEMMLRQNKQHRHTEGLEVISPNEKAESGPYMTAKPKRSKQLIKALQYY